MHAPDLSLLLPRRIENRGLSGRIPGYDARVARGNRSGLEQKAIGLKQ